MQDEHEKQLIASFGGLTNVIELCLTNHRASEYINTECKQFETFKQSLMDKVGKQNQSDNTYSANNTTINTNSGPKELVQILHTSKDFNQSKIILGCDPKNSLLFKLIKNGKYASNENQLATIVN